MKQKYSKKFILSCIILLQTSYIRPMEKDEWIDVTHNDAQAQLLRDIEKNIPSIQQFISQSNLIYDSCPILGHNKIYHQDGLNLTRGSLRATVKVDTVNNIITNIFSIELEKPLIPQDGVNCQKKKVCIFKHQERLIYTRIDRTDKTHQITDYSSQKITQEFNELGEIVSVVIDA